MTELVGYDDLAVKAAGNWKRFDSFAWHERPEDADNWCIVYTSNRDSGLLDQSNAATIEKIMEPFTEGDDPDCVAERYRHWAVGHVDGYRIRVYLNGQVTKAFAAWCDIQERLSDYPVLDDEDYSRREYDATLENIESAASMRAGWLAGSEGVRRMELPDECAPALFSWFWENNQSAVENRDDQGGYPSDDDLDAAFLALGWLEYDPKMESGYCFTLSVEGEAGDWEVREDELWDTEVYTPTGEEQYVGTRRIDCAEMNVWRCPITAGAVEVAAVYRAQTKPS